MRCGSVLLFFEVKTFAWCFEAVVRNNVLPMDLWGYMPLRSIHIPLARFLNLTRKAFLETSTS